MHSSYSLASDDFAVERNGTSEPLASLWPGGWRPDDRLGVLLANPMDAVGCSNLICGTITLFYDHLRATKGTGNFFRYSDVYLFGVGSPARDGRPAQDRLRPGATANGRQLHRVGGMGLDLRLRRSDRGASHGA